MSRQKSKVNGRVFSPVILMIFRPRVCFKSGGLKSLLTVWTTVWVLLIGLPRWGLGLTEAETFQAEEMLNA